MKPPKWTDVYPHGTKKGDEELKFFISLARHPKYQWRSTSSIAKESGLTKERVEEIIQKYHKKGMVFQNPKNEEQWGYWERVPDMLPDAKLSISGKDQSDRIDKAVSKDVYVDDDFLKELQGGMQMKSTQLKDQWITVYDSVSVKDDGNRCIWYVDLEGVSPAKAEQFIASMKNIFQKKKAQKDPELAENKTRLDKIHPDSLKKLEELKLQVLAQNPQIMGVAVPEQLGETEDAAYFRKKLFEGLNFPKAPLPALD